MEHLLYYPYINMPNNAWTARTLLYYDRVGSIVPQKYFYEPDNYDPFMREMVRAELIEPINPITTLEKPWRVSRPFIEYLGNDDFKLKKRRRLFQKGELTIMGRSKAAFSGPAIHADKFDSEIFYQLEQMGLAIRKDRDWYIVERKTADELMTFLASILGKKMNYQPVTDEIKNRFSLAHRSKQNFKDQRTINTRREIILNRLIPFPEEIDLHKLRHFKDKHLDLLKSFKNKIELIVLNPSIEEGSLLFDETIRELQIRKDELSAKMNEDKLGQIFFGTICGIAGATFGMSTADTSNAIIGGLPGFANAIYSALKIENAEDTFDQSGMKYLALVDKRLRRPQKNEQDRFGLF